MHTYIHTYVRRLKLRRFTIEAERPKAACILVHGYGQSAHFEFLCATYPGGPHSTWDDSILQHLADTGISCHALDLQVSATPLNTL